MYTYEPTGVCSRKIEIDITGSKIVSVNFTGGCPGNLFGISTLVEGMEIKEAIEKLKGITCKDKSTSCPDQLSKALEEIASSM
jgi:uncharacterized protein (TIGR03905 family)